MSREIIFCPGCGKEIIHCGNCPIAKKNPKIYKGGPCRECPWEEEHHQTGSFYNARITDKKGRTWHTECAEKALAKVIAVEGIPLKMG
jgi:hypothetical protein